jgi:hypothetical protein
MKQGHLPRHCILNAGGAAAHTYFMCDRQTVRIVLLITGITGTESEACIPSVANVLAVRVVRTYICMDTNALISLDLQA